MLPVPAKDYPRTWNEFLDWFGNEEACQSYLERLRWPDGFVCPSCGHREMPYRASRLRLMCRQCSHQASITAGTIFDKTRTPLRVWFAAAWYLTNQKQGVSALGLQRVLGLGSYQTAWTMLHRLRRAMVRPDRDQLKGHVEVDETYLDITDRISEPNMNLARGHNLAQRARVIQRQPLVRRVAPASMTSCMMRSPTLRSHAVSGAGEFARHFWAVISTA